MNIKEYEFVFFQRKEDVLPTNHQKDFFVKSFINEALNLRLSERICAGALTEVYYHECKDIKQVQQFHKDNYETKKLTLLQKKSAGTFFLESYNPFELESFQILKFNASQQETESLFFDKNYTLSQYNESLYANEQDELPIKEKLFYPSIWKIEEEDMD